jgi:hypothetical protein
MGKGTPKPVAPDVKITNAALADVGKVDPLDEFKRAKAKNFFEWEGGTGAYTGKPRNVMDAPGYGDLVDIYGSAAAMGAKQRIGSPQAAFSRGANPNFSRQLEAQNAMERYNTRAAGLSEGLTGLRNEAYGLANQSIATDAERRNSYANMLMKNQESFYNRPKEKPLWERIAGLAVGGLGAAVGGGSLFPQK